MIWKGIVRYYDVSILGISGLLCGSKFTLLDTAGPHTEIVAIHCQLWFLCKLCATDDLVPSWHYNFLLWDGDCHWQGTRTVVKADQMDSCVGHCGNGKCALCGQICQFHPAKCKCSNTLPGKADYAASYKPGTAYWYFILYVFSRGLSDRCVPR